MDIKQDATLVEVVNGYLAPEHIDQLSTIVGKSTSVVEKALTQVIPWVIRLLTERMARPQGAEAVWHLAKQAQEPQVLAQFNKLDIASWGGRGVALMQDLLKDTYDSTTFRMSIKVGLPPASFNLLLEVAVAAVVGGLGRYAAEHKLDAMGLRTRLQQQPLSESESQPTPTEQVTPTPNPTTRRSIPPRSRQPAPTFEAGAGDWASVGGGSIFIPKRRTLVGSYLSQLPFWKWPLLLLPVLAVGYSLLKWLPAADESALAGPNTPVSYTTGTSSSTNYGTTETDPTAASLGAQTPPGHYDAATDTYIYNTGQPLIITLADGSTQRVGMNSTEYQLYRFLADAHRRADSLNPATGWINVDRVYFKSGEATLTPESQQQLTNLAAILKTFPRAKILFGGYSDSIGDAAKNLRLSDARAQTAMRALAAKGISQARLQATGYGEAYAVASNTAPIGRALNRRLSIKVISKSGPLLPEPLKANTALAAGAAAQGAKSTRSTASQQFRQKKPRQRTKVGRWINNVRQKFRSKRNRQQG
ncbi:OmpA family protein [Hymenobacter sp. YC55]|uniref:OmpA family protein n=1 Tax=Hymenobacter sp. YC55 TaxID=3034019 RepID=UPI0023F9600E|nr:OmpA family protein [Hymenobacter sp. YC55]MDF7811552.1 OmpA family protein [Hymenobacter sp. YC55]